MAWLKGFVDFLNTNNGTITAIATVILAVITFWYATLTRKILKITDKPEILIFLFPSEANPYKINLCIQNIGTGLASDIKFSDDLSIIPTLPFDNTPLNKMSIFKDGIDYLGPGKKIEIGLFITHAMGELLNKSLEITVYYKDSTNGKHKDSFILNFCKWENFRQDEIPIISVANSLKSIA